MIVLQLLLGLFVVCSWVYWLLCLDSARRWARNNSVNSPSFQQPNCRETQLPPVTILKPVYGTDPEQLENFWSFCRQEYPAYQIVFGALDAGDPGLDAAREIVSEFLDRDISIVAGGEVFGTNRKVCNLESMLGTAKYDLLILCDSDMRVQPDYLKRVTAPFEDPKIGVVTCPYRGHLAEGLAGSLEALGIGADFIPSVLLTNRFWGIRFAFGSTIAIRTSVLEQIGGFRSLADELADDYLLGARAADAGYKVVLSDYVVDDVIGWESFREMWTRRLRWARTTRAMHPGPVFASFVTYGTAMSLIFAAVAHFGSVGWAAITATLTIRGATSTAIARLYTKDENLPSRLLLLPLSDLLSFALWALSFLGNTVEWRGERYRVGRHGRLSRVE